MCSNELGDSMLNTMRMTLKQNRRERDEKIIAIHSILPGDVISGTEKVGERGGMQKKKKKRSHRVSTRDKHRERLDKKKMRQTGWCRRAGDLKCIPLISRPQPLCRDAS